VIRSETIRIEEERLHDLAVAANAGKELDFFLNPELKTAQRAEIKKHDCHAKRRESRNKPLVAKRPNSGAEGKLRPKWNFF